MIPEWVQGLLISLLAASIVGQLLILTWLIHVAKLLEGACL